MSYFSIALQRESERRHLTQADVARHSGISRSYISRLFSGDRVDLSDEHFGAILNVFSADARAQAEIVVARCMDVRVGPGSELVEVRIKSGLRTQEPRVEPPQLQLSQEAERAFAWLRSQCPINMDLEKHLVGYARLMGMDSGT